MSAEVTQHPWSSEALFAKALVYIEEMETYSPTDRRFGLSSCFALELLARAALAHISPTLIAKTGNWREIHYALGHPSTKKDGPPISATTTAVISILQELLPSFSEELKNFSVIHCNRRNAELHSGETPFDGMDNAAWLPKFYATCSVFLKFMGKELSDFFSHPLAVVAMIDTLQETATEAVRQQIEAQRQIWNSKTADDRRTLQAQALVWATRHTGHRVDCPACGSTGIIRGSGQGPVTARIADDKDEVVQKQTMLPSSFECIACGLRISGWSKLSACGLGSLFTATTTLSPAEFFELHTDEELQEARASSVEPEFEEDFNEYGIGESES